MIFWFLELSISHFEGHISFELESEKKLSPFEMASKNAGKYQWIAYSPLGRDLIFQGVWFGRYSTPPLPVPLLVVITISICLSSWAGTPKARRHWWPSKQWPAFKRALCDGTLGKRTRLTPSKMEAAVFRTFPKPEHW